MKRTHPMKVSEIVTELLRSQNLEDRMLEHRALAAWPQIVGPAINRHTTERRISSGTLFLRIDSAPLRSELSLHTDVLLEALNKAAGKDVVKEIRFF